MAYLALYSEMCEVWFLFIYLFISCLQSLAVRLAIKGLQVKQDSGFSTILISFYIKIFGSPYFKRKLQHFH